MTTERKPDAVDASRQWLLVAVATGCGFAAAYNIGKLPPSIPALRAEFDTSLTVVAALVSSYSLIAMTCSLMMGGVVARLGIWRTVTAGLSLLVTGSVFGASTHQFELLLLARVLEGLGYLAIAVTMPAFVARVCSPANRSVALGVWGTFVPGGITLCMLVAPWLSSVGGWRALWWAGAAGAFVLLVVASVVIRPEANKLHSAQVRPPIRSAFNRTTVLLSVVFALYSMAFTGLATFLPTFWSETAEVTLATATKLTGLVVAVNILGNLCGGWLNQRGVPLRLLLWAGVTFAAVFGFITYIESAGFEIQVLTACLFSFIAGIAPATLFSSAAALSDSPAHNGLLVGLLFQGAGFGQVMGPLLVGALVDSAGNWSLTPLYFVFCGIPAMIIIAFLPWRIARQ